MALGTYTGVTTSGNVVALPQTLLKQYSEDLEHEALGVMLWQEFVVPKLELQAQPGNTIVFTKYKNISRGGPILETDDIEPTNLSAAQTSIMVTEYGNAIGVTEKELRMASDDTMREMAFQLGRDYGMVVDFAIRDVAYQGSNVIYAGANVSRAAMDSTDVFDVETVRRAVEILQTNNAPRFRGRNGEAPFYVCYCHPHQAMSLTRDADWKDANNYAQTRNVFNGELGRWMDVVFIASSYIKNGVTGAGDDVYDAALHGAAVAGGGSADVYKAVIMGDNAIGWASALPVEMRMDTPQNFGRRYELAWYSIMGFGILNDEHIVNIETT